MFSLTLPLAFFFLRFQTARLMSIRHIWVCNMYWFIKWNWMNRRATTMPGTIVDNMHENWSIDILSIDRRTWQMWFPFYVTDVKKDFTSRFFLILNLIIERFRFDVSALWHLFWYVEHFIKIQLCRFVLISMFIANNWWNNNRIIEPVRLCVVHLLSYFFCDEEKKLYKNSFGIKTHRVICCHGGQK